MRNALITGASRGFGRELATVFLERGWTVFPLVRRAESAGELKAAGGERCHPIVADVAAEDVEARITTALSANRTSLDLLVNNAGHVKKLRWLDRTTQEDLEDLFRVHCVGAFRCTRAALPFLRAADKAMVVNVTSRFGSIARAAAGLGGGIYSYQIAKCAQNMLTACMDQELRQQGIRVVAVHPGRLTTDSAAMDADVPPRDAAVRLLAWLEAFDSTQPCRCHDLMAGGFVDW